MKKYRFIEDPGHGWLEVPCAELHTLGIADKISGYSYLLGGGKNGLAYLEEDCDLSTFARAKGWTVENAWLNWGKPDYQENTFVRNLPHYDPNAEPQAGSWSVPAGHRA